MEKQRRKKYSEVHRETNVAPLSQMINYGYPSQEMVDLLNIRPIIFIGVYSQERVNLYCDVDYWTEVGKKIILMAENNTKFFKSLRQKFDRYYHQALKEIHWLDKDKIFVLNKEILAKKIKHLSYDSFVLSVLSQVGAIADIHHNCFSDLLLEIISKNKNLAKTGITAGEIINTLTDPTGVSPHDLARRELLSQRRKIKNNSTTKGELTNKFFARWFWLDHGQIGPGYSPAELLAKLQKGESEKASKDRLKSQQNKLIKILRLNDAEKRLFRVAQQFVYMKGVRAEICDGTWAILNLTMNKIEKEFGIEKKYLRYCSIPEFINYFLEKSQLPELTELKKRRQFSVWIPKNVFSTKIITGQLAEDFLRKNVSIINQEIKVVGEVKGSVAFPGQVIGMVKIINHPAEMGKMKSGDIMVSIQTMPELMPAMKKAAAFVTDIGGITSHAAIVAREMKVPCIVGTKIATKIFKDGDRVEVDANKGIVRKL